MVLNEWMNEKIPVTWQTARNMQKKELWVQQKNCTRPLTEPGVISHCSLQGKDKLWMGRASIRYLHVCFLFWAPLYRDTWHHLCSHSAPECGRGKSIPTKILEGQYCSVKKGMQPCFAPYSNETSFPLCILCLQHTTPFLFLGRVPASFSKAVCAD